LRPRKKHIGLEIKLPRSDDIDDKLQTAGIETLEYSNRWGTYRLALSREDIDRHRAFLKELIGIAHQNRVS
jgi:hypothetical protein